MTKEDKFKLGLMGYEEYIQWQEELAEEAAREAERQDEPAAEKKSENHTFWEDDEGDRENVSKEEFDNFLAQNSIDVSNSTAVDIDSLLSENS